MTDAKGVDKDIQVDLISDKHVVREIFDKDKMIEFGLLMLDGVVFPRIKVYEEGNGGYVMGDGRTRLGGYREAGIKMIPCTVFPKAKAYEILADGFIANGNGSSPMTFADAKRTMGRMIEHHASREFVVKAFCQMYPKSRCGALYLEAFNNLRNRHCAEAMLAMSKAPKMSVEEAAQKFGVTVAQLSGYIARKQNRKANSENGIKQKIIVESKHYSDFIHRHMKKLMEEVTVGESSMERAQGILSLLLKKHSTQGRQLGEWQQRFASMSIFVSDSQSFDSKKTQAGIEYRPMRKQSKKVA